MRPDVSRNIETQLRDLVEASCFREALALFLEWSDQPVELTPHAQLFAAHAASRIGAFDLAGTLARAVQREFRACGNEDAVLDCTNLLGAVAFERGSIDDAEAQFLDVLRTAEDSGCARFTARGANNLAVIAELRGDRERAAALYRKALEAYRRVDDERGLIETRHNLTLSRMHAGRTDEMLHAFDRAVDAAERLGAGGLIALTLMGRAEHLIQSGEYDRAAGDLERARVLAWLEGSEPAVLEADRLGALLTLRRGEPDRAHRHAEQVRLRATSSGCAWIAAESAAIAALALKAGRRLPEAAAANDLAVASLVALGATGRLERHARAWREVAA